MRTLASIKQISGIQPIAGKDRIALATVDGWSVIVQKKDYAPGDLCVYCEIDSVLPEKPEFEFLRSKGFRIKTMKMAGVVSQGICFPLSILPQGRYQLGDDVTQILGVKQYEPTMDKEPSASNARQSFRQYPKFLMQLSWFRQLVYRKDRRAGKGFPSFIKKTDEIRIQNIPSVLENKTPFVATEKIDGQSGTFVLVKRKRFLLPDTYEYMVCSRNLRLFKKDNSSYWSVSERYGIEDILKKLIGKHDWVCIQGECIAPNVQGNKYKVSKPDLYVFNLICPNGRLGSIEAKQICEAHGLQFVPVLNESFVLPDTVDEVLRYAHGQSAIGDTLREGIVFRAQDGGQSFKAVDPLFLIQYDE